MSVMVPVSWGELIDRYTILEIKAERIQDPAKVANVRRELDALVPLRDMAISMHFEMLSCEADLKSVNKMLWDVEDRIRNLEREKDFGTNFINLARRVYRENDRRAEIKLKINKYLNSDILEEKSYTKY